MNKKLLLKIFLIIIAIASNVLIIKYVDRDSSGNMILQFSICSDNDQEMQVYYDITNKDEWSENNSQKINYEKKNGNVEIMFLIPQKSKNIRLDLGNVSSVTEISNVKLSYSKKNYSCELKDIIVENKSRSISDLKYEGNAIIFTANREDPYLYISLSGKVYEQMQKTYTKYIFVKNILLCLIIDLFVVLLIIKINSWINLVYSVVVNRNLILNLAQNDFKTKYAGSYLGAIWAFVQPVVTILVYWFVFGVAFKGGPVHGCPYVLWLVSGLIPWFFFQEALQSCTNSLIEYNYLVKKVVFNIGIIPMVKVLSAFFVHLFFVAILIVIYCVSGYGVAIQAIQVVYYSICMVVLVVGLGYLTSALVVFFRDLGQIIGIVLQIGIWLTPIMWNYETIGGIFGTILRLNPMFYIVNGYRESLIFHQWFWNNPNLTIYFWVVACVIMAIGVSLFEKLKVHFADVL